MLSDTTNQRVALRDLIAENEGKRRNGAASDGRGWYRNDADRGDCYAVADAVLDLFEVGKETWLIATVPGVNGPVDIKTQIRMPDREPVTHTRFVLRTEPVPVRPGDAEGGAR